MNRDLLLAILAMDSYKRGYDRNVETPGDTLGPGDHLHWHEGRF